MARIVPILLLVSCLCPATRAGDLLYVVEDGRVVFTNTPKAGARRVDIAEPRMRTAGRGVPLPPSRFDRMIDEVAELHDLDRGLLKAVVWAESAFDPEAVSPKGALGLMQLMPATAAMYGVREPFDPYENLSAGARHLRRLLDDFDGDLTLALAAYNAGEGAVRRSGGVPAYRETRSYVSRIRGKLEPARRRGAPVDPRPIQASRGDDGELVFSN